MTLREDKSLVKETAFFQYAKLFHCSCFFKDCHLISLLIRLLPYKFTSKMVCFVTKAFFCLSVLSLGKVL